MGTNPEYVLPVVGLREPEPQVPPFEVVDADRLLVFLREHLGVQVMYRDVALPS